MTAMYKYNPQKPIFRDSQKAFQHAIDQGVLSENPKADNFAALYMYMDSGYGGKADRFKNINTRRYIDSVI